MARTKVTMTLDGLQALQRAITSAPAVVRTHASSAVAASSFAIAQSARALAPVATGTLRANIISSRVVGGLTGSVGLASKEAFYWRFVEYGTVNAPARPFFRPAAETESGPFIQRMRAIGPRLERDLSAGRLV